MSAPGSWSGSSASSAPSPTRRTSLRTPGIIDAHRPFVGDGSYHLTFGKALSGTNEPIATLARLDVRYTMTVRAGTSGVGRRRAIDEEAWVDIDYLPGGQAPGHAPHPAQRSLPGPAAA